MVWPVHESEILAITQSGKSLDAKTFLPDLATIIAGQDKIESYRRFAANGVRTPESVKIDDAGDLRAAFDSFGPEVWLRMTGGAGGKGALPVTEFDRAVNWIDFHDGWGKFQAARRIVGGRWTSESIWRDGELIAIQGRHNLLPDLSNLTPSGITGFTRAKTWIDNPALDDISIRAVKALADRPHGIFAVDLLDDEAGDFYVTEVNVGRFSSGGFSHYNVGSTNACHFVASIAFGEELPFDPPLMNPLPQNELMIAGYSHNPVHVLEQSVEEQVEMFQQELAKLKAEDTRPLE